MESTVNIRLKELLKYLGKNSSQFAKELGYSSPEKINRLLRDSEKEMKPSFDIIRDITNKFAFINIEWLINGEGDMLKEGSERLIVNDEDIQYTTYGKNNKKKEKGMVPYYDIDFAAGSDVVFIDDNSVSPEYYMDIPEFSGCTAFRVYSDSMEKLIKSGSIVFGTRVEDWMLYLEYGQIYGITAKDGRRFIKYIRRAQDHKKEFILKSENSFYDDFNIPKKSIRSVWLIHGWLNKRV